MTGPMGFAMSLKRRLPFRGLEWDSLVKLPSHGTVRGASPGRAAVGARFQNPTQIDMVVCGWACVPRLAVRSGTCRNALSNDSHGGRSVQGRRAGAIR